MSKGGGALANGGDARRVAGEGTHEQEEEEAQLLGLLALDVGEGEGLAVRVVHLGGELLHVEREDDPPRDRVGLHALHHREQQLQAEPLQLQHLGDGAAGAVVLDEAGDDVAEVGADEKVLVAVARALDELDQGLEELARQADRQVGQRALEHEQRVDELHQHVDLGAVPLLLSQEVLRDRVVPLAEQLDEV